MNSDTLSGKVAIVTGGTKGLGLAIARALGAAGADVVAASRSTIPDERFDGITWDRVDVTRRESVDALFARVGREHGGPHIVVANAGVNRSARIARMESADWHAVINTNLNGTFYTVQAAAKVMKRDGRIITVSSCMGNLAGKGMGAYGASKAGIDALTRVAAQELGKDGISVIGISPGILDEGMGETVMNKEHLWERYRPHLAMGRTGTVEEVGRIVVFLAGPETEYLNGATIAIDGGILPWA